jgi:signal transduction histidine kinase/ligand-binding sensor domain-containing protein
VLALVWLLAITARGADDPAHTPAEYSLREWHPLDGLPSEDVSRVLQGRDGFLWVLTVGGLVRFDGARFESITPRDEHHQPLPLMRALVETPEHGLVVAPNHGGLLALRDGAWQPITLPAEVATRTFITLFAAPDGALWAGCEDGTLLRTEALGTRVFQTKDGLHGRAVFTFATDGSGRLWIANGIFLHRYERGGLVTADLSFAGSELRIGSSAGDSPWIAADDRLGKIIGREFAGQATLPPLLGAHYIQTLQEDHHGVLWVGTRSQGVFLFRAGRLQPVGTSHEDVISLTIDTEGSVWAATNGGGLNRLRPKIFTLYDKTSGLGDNFSDTVCEDLDGIIWFGNRDGGLAFLRNQAVVRVPNPPEWPILSVVSVSPHPEGGIWSTAGPGLFRVARAASPVMAAIPQPRLPIIRATYTARDGALWFAADPDRIARLKDGLIRIFGPEDGYPPAQVRYITESPDGRIWCGTATGKLYRLSGERFAPVPVDLPTGAINALHFDARGNPWLGTAHAGLVVRLDGKWRAVNTAHGLPENTITQILADDRGYLWFGSVRGIFYASEKELLDCLTGRSTYVHAVLLGKDEGLKELSCLGFFQPAAWKSRDGLLWFTTRKGVLRLDPTLATPETPPPPVRIEEVRSDNQILPVKPRLQIGADMHKLEIRFSALCLATPERVQARYRLDGFDDDWVTAPPNRVATYPRLPPGEYVFRASAGFGDGVANSDTFTLVVPPPWWQTWWWRTLAFGGLVSAVVVIVRTWSHRRLKQKLERLERESAIERERTRIAQNLHDDIGASLTRISLLTQSVHREGSEHAADLEKIYQTASEITRSLDETVWAVNPKYDDLESLVYYLGNFAQQFLGVARIRCRLDVPDGLPPVNLTSQARHNLFLCCKEALNNIVKHAAATEATLSMAVAGDRFTITITDNGRGPATAPAGTPNRISSGHGLVNLRQRMTGMGGRMDLQPAPEHGTIVVFEIALDRLRQT